MEEEKKAQQAQLRYSFRERKPATPYSPPQPQRSPRKTRQKKNTKGTPTTATATTNFFGPHQTDSTKLPSPPNTPKLHSEDTPSLPLPQPSQSSQPSPPPLPPPAPIFTRSPNKGNNNSEPATQESHSATKIASTKSPRRGRPPGSRNNAKTPKKDTQTAPALNKSSSVASFAVAPSPPPTATTVPIEIIDDDRNDDDDDDDDFIILPVKKASRAEAAGDNEKKPRTRRRRKSGSNTSINSNEPNKCIKAFSSPQVLCSPSTAQSQTTLLSSSFVVVEHAARTAPLKRKDASTPGKRQQPQQRQTTLFGDSPRPQSQPQSTATPRSLDEARERLLLESMEFNRIVERFTSKSATNPLFAPLTPQRSAANRAQTPSSSGPTAGSTTTGGQRQHEGAQEGVVDITADLPVAAVPLSTHVTQLTAAEEAALWAGSGKPELELADSTEAFTLPNQCRFTLSSRIFADEEEEEKEDEKENMHQTASQQTDTTATLKELHEILYGKPPCTTADEEGHESWAGVTEERYRKLKDESEREGAQHMLWVDKYKPRSLDMMCGNRGQFEALSRWLSRWSLGATAATTHTAAAANSGRGRARSKWNAKEEEEDEDEQPRQRAAQNMCVIQGDFSTCKTAGVYTCAAEHGMEVIEINASELRSAKQIAKIGEASSTRQFASVAAAAATTTAVRSVLPAEMFFSKNNSKGKQKQQQQGQQNEVKRRRLFLFEDIDVFFPCDTDMHSSIIALEQKTSYPIVATCRCNNYNTFANSHYYATFF